jgi:signal transduction histidine kinase
VSVLTVELLTPILLITIAIGMSAALIAWRERPEPGATPLVVMLAGQSWWSAFLVLDLEATSLPMKVLLADVRWIGVVAIPVAWFLFALEYTGRDEYVRPRNAALLSIVPAITVVLALTGQYNDLLYVDSELVTQGGATTLSRTPGPWFWVITAYTYLLGLLGSIPLLDLVRSDAVSFRGQSVALLVGTLVPWASNVLFLVGAIPVPGLDPTPIAFSISGVAYLGALTRFRLFGTNPSPNRRARHLVFKRMHEGAVVVDSHDYVVDLNERAADILGVSPADVLGTRARDAIPEYESYPGDGTVPGHLAIDDGTTSGEYDVTVTRITDVRDRPLGRVITFHDISEHLRQQQRLKVLNRILRHNIRTETNLIHGYADLLAEDSGSTEIQIVKNRAKRIEEMGEKGRTVIDIFDNRTDDAVAVPLESVLERCVSAVDEAYPGVRIERRGDDDDALVDDVVRPVLSNLVENAAEHNTNDNPRVWLTVQATDETVQLEVADNGPGIDDYERAVLERGTETPLKHGSGLGLWLVKWGTDIAGGDVTFDENSPRGSLVTVTVPRRGTAATSEDVSPRPSSA